MIVYVESNFVLEWVFEQQEFPAVENLLSQSEEGRIRLAIPSVALVEPIWSIDNTRSFKDLLSGLDNLRTEIARRPNQGEVRRQIQEMIATLRNLQSDHEFRLGAFTTRILDCGAAIPLDSLVLKRSLHLERPLRLQPLDAIVLASILEDLKAQSQHEEKVFCSRDTTAFSGQAVGQHLQQHNCRFISSYGHTVDFVMSRLNAT